VEGENNRRAATAGEKHYSQRLHGVAEDKKEEIGIPKGKGVNPNAGWTNQANESAVCLSAAMLVHTFPPNFNADDSPRDGHH
jgi:hypothetical protein